MTALLISLVVSQTPPAPVGAGVDAALALLGSRYEWGGRLRKQEGIDCYGVVLAAAERASGCGWKSYPVKPTEIVAQRLWGAPADGLSPVATDALDASQLQAGDVLMLVGPTQNPAEPAIATLDGKSVWVWHVGLALGDGRFVVGDHHAGKTVIERVATYLDAHRDEYSGVFVVRGPAARPARCRVHAPLVPRPAKSGTAPAR